MEVQQATELRYTHPTGAMEYINVCIYIYNMFEAYLRADLIHRNNHAILFLVGCFDLGEPSERDKV